MLYTTLDALVLVQVYVFTHVVHWRGYYLNLLRFKIWLISSRLLLLAPFGLLVYLSLYKVVGKLLELHLLQLLLLFVGHALDVFYVKFLFVFILGVAAGQSLLIADCSSGCGDYADARTNNDEAYGTVGFFFFKHHVVHLWNVTFIFTWFLLTGLNTLSFI